MLNNVLNIYTVRYLNLIPTLSLFNSTARTLIIAICTLVPIFHEFDTLFMICVFRAQPWKNITPFPCFFLMHLLQHPMEVNAVAPPPPPPDNVFTKISALEIVLYTPLFESVITELEIQAY